ncbi:hypothetical protein XELAEV_18001885mg [Xenopus laevis]|uniref:Uncharacterized protein n=1 Tax=Xenopus laevis TaxID=8355 RepID=A0A974BNS4_XENLA|nr:hypothetical protein XELAEV_18001885mg [Xenopus laevis]
MPVEILCTGLWGLDKSCGLFERHSLSQLAVSPFFSPSLSPPSLSVPLPALLSSLISYVLLFGSYNNALHRSTSGGELT